MRWIVHGYVPCKELVLVYGRGGIGKSSFATWVAAQTTKKGKRFAFLGTEERPEFFLGRAVMAGADINLLYGIEGTNIKLPKDANIVREMIEESQIDVFYFDSIYTHFDHSTKLNIATEARESLAPLLDVAHKSGCTILGTFHENKVGGSLGPEETLNLARCVLHATRSETETVLKLKVKKTNLFKPKKVLQLEGRAEDFNDGQGNYLMDELDDGSLVRYQVMIPTRIADADPEPENDEEAPKLSAEEVLLVCLRENPNASIKELAGMSNYKEGTIRNKIKAVRARL